MTNTDQKREDEVLKRLLKTPPTKNEPKKATEKKNGADPKTDPA